MKYSVKLVETISGILIVIMVLAALAQVLFRYVLRISVPWTEELARLLFVWVVYLTLLIVENENSQLKTTYFLDKMPRKVRTLLQLLIECGSIVFLIGLFFGALQMFRTSTTLHYGTMPWMSTSVSYLPIIIAVPFSIFYIGKRSILIIREAIGKTDKK